MIKFILNQNEVTAHVNSNVTLLDFIRYHQHLTGTKIGCREGDCGACTILVGSLMPGHRLTNGDAILEYRSATSCLMPIGNARGKHIVTIEGINFNDRLNPIQKAMSDEGATQCGFCTPGFVMSLAGYCLSDNEMSEKNALACIDGNICRCTGYKSIERAAMKINSLLKEKEGKSAVAFVTSKNILPDYFSTIAKRLQDLKSDLSEMIADPKKVYLGGGTDLYVQKHDAMHYADVELLFDKSALNGIIQQDNVCTMGGAVTVTDLINSPIIQKYFPDFEKHSKLVSSTPIRNMATLAGNFVNASPIGDFTVFFLALNAHLHLSNGTKKRMVPLRDFYKGYKVIDKQVDEYIETISFELPDSQSHFNFEKVCKRTHLDIATVNTAAHFKSEGEFIASASISAGGVGPVPMFLPKTSACLSEKKISADQIQQAIEMAQTEISPISDARGSESYKRLLLSQLIKAHVVEMFDIKLHNLLK